MKGDDYGAQQAAPFRHRYADHWRRRGNRLSARTIATPAVRLALLPPDVFQLALERMARRRGWSTAIQALERDAAERLDSGSD